MSPQFDRLPAGSLILITGGTGLIGSAVTTLLLARGFKVRVATRSVSKQELFKLSLETKYGKDAVEFVEVDDYAKEEAWDRILKGVAGVQHLASDVSFSTDYEGTIKATKDMTLTFLNTANKHDTIKSVVLTSSRIAAYNPEHGKDLNITKNDWTTYFFELAENASVDDPAKAVYIYAASKIVEEQVAWEFVEKSKPHFAFSAVLPDYVSGPVANPSPGSYSTHGWLNEIYDGKVNGLGGQVMNPAARLVDVRDVAAIHVAAMLDETNNGRRLFAAPHKYTLNQILAVWRDALPGRNIRADVDFDKQPDINVDDGESTALLQAFLGRGWISFKESVVANVQSAL